MIGFLKSKQHPESSDCICIDPADKDMKLQLQSLWILNEFKNMGFDNRSGFVGVVQLHIDEYKNYDNLKKLFNFWSGRLKDADLNNQLENLLNKLKNE